MIAVTLLCLIIHVSDGDTLTARCNSDSARAPQTTQTLKVRLAGIDAPESRQPYGSQARKALQTLVLKKNVTLRCHTIDRYKRHICTVWVAATGHGTHTLDVGHALLTQGMAWWYRQYAAEQSPQQRSQYEWAEKSARAKRAGLWGSRKPPVAPWQWRAAQKRRSR